MAGLFHIAGVGIWALGMDGNDPAMIAALLGNAPVVKNYLPGPGATVSTTSSTTTTTEAPVYSYGGVWNGSAVDLAPAVLATLPDDGAGVAAGELSGFSTNDPAVSCLASGPRLAILVFLRFFQVLFIQTDPRRGRRFRTSGRCRSYRRR